MCHSRRTTPVAPRCPNRCVQARHLPVDATRTYWNFTGAPLNLTTVVREIPRTTHPPAIPLTMIREVTDSDTAAICAIYNPYITGTTITFEEEIVPVEVMKGRIAEITKTHPWIVSEIDGRVVGYAYGAPWKTRTAYRHSAESTVYLDSSYCQRGLGTALYRELIERLRKARVHRLMGGIALPNEASVTLHERLGFKKVAHFDEVGWKFGQWIDVAYWQLDL